MISLFSNIRFFGKRADAEPSAPPPVLSGHYSFWNRRDTANLPVSVTKRTISYSKEIWQEIFKYLPLESFAQARVTCKTSAICYWSWSKSTNTLNSQVFLNVFRNQPSRKEFTEFLERSGNSLGFYHRMGDERRSELIQAFFHETLTTEAYRLKRLIYDYDNMTTGNSRIEGKLKYSNLQVLEFRNFDLMSMRTRDMIDEFLKLFANAPNLTSLSLKKNPNKGDCPTWNVANCIRLISSFPSLIHLEIDGVEHDEEEVHLPLDIFDKLQSVHIGTYYDTKLRFLTQIKNLTSLKLKNSYRAKEIPVEDVSRILVSSTSLKKLECDSQTYYLPNKSKSAAYFPNLVNLTSLKELKLRDKCIFKWLQTFENISHFREISGLINLEKLFLGNIKSPSDQFITLFQRLVKDSPLIETLSIINCDGVNAAALKILAKMPHLQRLELQLTSQNETTDYNIIGSYSQLRKIKMNFKAYLNHFATPYCSFVDLLRILSNCCSLEEIDLTDHDLMRDEEIAYARTKPKKLPVIHLPTA